MSNAEIVTYNYRNRGDVTFAQFYPQRSKQLIDEIDTLLAGRYDLTEDELDFIVNYDIKYRMGRDGDPGVDEE